MAAELLASAQTAWEGFDPSSALEATWRLVRSYNQKIDEAKPWVLHKSGKLDELNDVLTGCCEAVRWAALMVAPAMPDTAREILRQLGRGGDAGSWPTQWGWPGGTLTQPTPVFPRIEPERQTALIDTWTGAAEKPQAAPTKADVSIDDFAKLDLRVAKVVAAKRVAGADKLLELTLDIGGEQRTVASGIAPTYAPEEMVGKTVIYLANLAPRKIRGVLSQGMILAAGDAQVLALSGLDRDAPPGTLVR